MSFLHMRCIAESNTNSLPNKKQTQINAGFSTLNPCAEKLSVLTAGS